jgi:hypothetical protein
MEKSVSYDETALGTEKTDELIEITNLPSDDTIKIFYFIFK